MAPAYETPKGELHHQGENISVYQWNRGHYRWFTKVDGRRITRGRTKRQVVEFTKGWIDAGKPERYFADLASWSEDGLNDHVGSSNEP